MLKRGLYLFSISLLVLTFLVAGCASETTSQKNEHPSGNNLKKPVFPGQISLSTTKGVIGTSVHFSIKGLKPNRNTQVLWKTVEGNYDFSGLYKFVGVSFKDKVIPLLNNKSNSSGDLEGDFKVPGGFGGNHTILVEQDGKMMTQANIHINPTFKIWPESGPVGTEVSIIAEGIGYDVMERNWQLTYDNQLTGLITAITTNGSAVAKFRAAGAIGKHTLTVWHGYLGIPYVNHEQAPTSYLPVPKLTFTVTNEKANLKSYVEPVPKAADGGVVMPRLKNQKGVNISLDKKSGIVGEPVTIKGVGLPKNQTVNIVWNTMRGSRVSGNGFGDKKITLVSVAADNQGTFTKTFPVPDDLGGVPHRIDLQVKGKTYGQTYLSITPSIVSISPTSGPPGTPIRIELKGVGWTEYDNTYDITYDNAYFGYVCGFNSAGTVIVNLVASGSPGYHLIDFYPGIYRGQQQKPDIYLAPQLTYEKDHPGSGIPAIRMGFEVTKP